jgi:hypothetical protein
MLQLENIFTKVNRFHCMIPVLFGIASYILIVGPLAIIPTNIGWLGGGFDSTQHYLGWAFFRFSPWTFPVGLNPNFGLEISSSIVYSDSIPLFAIFFKIFHSYLPEPFQYFGIWMLLSFILQALFAWLLAGLMTSDKWLKFLVMGIIACSPIMWHRLGFQFALSSHFVILASLYLALRSQYQLKPWQWPLLITISGLIHAYLLAMVLCIWLSNYVSRFIQNKKSISLAIISEVAIICITLGIALWQAGYFSIGESGVVTHSTYGIGKLNLLTPFNPENWSYVIPKFPLSDSSYESFNYYGLGILLLIPFAIFCVIKNKSPFLKMAIQHKILIICCLCLTIFAISNTIGIGSWQLTVHLPKFILDLASIFRASGRFFWPAYYLSVFLLLQIICSNSSKLRVKIVLSICLLIQIADTSPGWRIKRYNLMQPVSSSINQSLTDPFWSVAAIKYKRVERTHLPYSLIEQYYQDWVTWANYAAIHHLGTNSAYLSRISDKNLQSITNKLNSEISSGVYRVETLYILEDDKAIDAIKNLNFEKDLLAKIDGVNVLAPDWYNCLSCQEIPSTNWVLFKDLVPTVGEKLPATHQGMFKSHGWSSPEYWGIWTDGHTSNLTVPIPKNGAKNFIITARAYLGKKHERQVVKMTANGKKYDLSLGNSNKIIIPLRPQDLESGVLRIHFQFENPLRPIDEGDGNDSRALGLGVEEAYFE